MKGSQFWILLGCVLALVYGSFTLWRKTNAAALATAPITSSASSSKGPHITEFALTDQAGANFDSKSLQGQVWVGSFFFTNCSGSCWRLNQAIADWQYRHPHSNVRFVSITCDPANDTPESLTRYAEHFHADPERWTFLTGEMDLIVRIGNDMFQVAVQNATHTDHASVVDRQGQLRGRFRLTDPDQLKILERLLDVVEAEQSNVAPIAGEAAKIGEPATLSDAAT